MTTNNNSKNNVNDEDFQVIIASQDDDSETVVLTSREMAQQWLEKAMYNFNNNYHQYTTFLNENSLGVSFIKNEEIDILSDNPQNDIQKIKKINSYSRYFINRDDLIGKVYETIENNVNTDFKLSYKEPEGGRNKQKILDKTKSVIDNFNKQINLKQLLRKSIPITYSDGNYIMYLRKNNSGNYVVDQYPIGVVEVSDYEIDGEPILIIDMTELKSRLQKANKKMKNGKSLFFNNIDDEIKNNYPPEVYSAHINKEKYAKLDIKSTGLLRINNMNRKYGVTPIFRTFKSATMLDTFEKTERINAKAKGKKIIFQKLHKELLGPEGQNKSFEEMAYAHDSFMAAWKSETVIYTGAAFVEEIKYIEPSVANINIDNINYYRNKIMTGLGIGFLNQDSKQTFTVANISVKELLKQINKISEQLEDVLEKWYKVVLETNGIPLEYCPNIDIIDSEQMEIDVKLKIAEILFSKLNASYESVFKVLGMDIEDEKQKRKKENDEKLDEVFKPRVTAYTNSGDSKNVGGRPIDNNDPDKQEKDQERRSAE